MDRRTFLSTGLAGLAASAWACPGGDRARFLSAPGPGIQLYTVRRPMAQDVAGTLAALARIGYAEVELAGLYGHKPADFRKLLDAAGLHAPAGHTALAPLQSNPGQVLDDAIVLGQHWVIVPWLEAGDRTPEGMRRVADALNEAGAKARERGLRVGYHNHEFEFVTTNGETLFDILLERTEPALVDFELDLFWIRRGGRDPLDYFDRFPGRFVALHVKDMAADGSMVNVGAGTIDFAGIFTHADRAGVRHYFVEHDEPTDPLNDARASFAALQRLMRVE